jgi:hypothetical protein
VTWRALDELTPRKSIASVHLNLFQWPLTNGPLDAMGYLYPPLLTHLRLLDCVEVQEGARHLEDHIQSIQMLNSSSIDLHMLSVCA